MGKNNRASLPLLVLASSSPRRKSLLRQIGFPVLVVHPKVKEPSFRFHLSLRKQLEDLALQKAQSIQNIAISAALKLRRNRSLFVCSQTRKQACGLARKLHSRYPKAYILGADTVVTLDKKVLGKPANPEEAIQMLQMLRGRVHEVMTGVALLHGKKIFRGSAVTKVWFRQFSDPFIREYVKTGEPMGKAGAYAIQGLGLLCAHKIEGDYFNVVGLPLFMVLEFLRKASRRKLLFKN